MNENEIMMTEETTMEPVYEVEVETEDSGMSTGVAMLIGSGLTLLGLAGVRFGKKAYHRIEAHRARKAEANNVVEGEVIEDIDDDEVVDEPKK